MASAPRLYVDSLNEMIDQQTVRAAGLGNRVPTEVLFLEVIGAALAMFLLGLHVGVLGRSVMPSSWPRVWSPPCCSSPSTSIAPRAASSRCRTLR